VAVRSDEEKEWEGVGVMSDVCQQAYQKEYVTSRYKVALKKTFSRRTGGLSLAMRKREI